MLLSTGCGFDDMVKRKSMSGGAGEESLEGIIQTLKDLIAQVNVKIAKLVASSKGFRYSS